MWLVNSNICCEKNIVVIYWQQQVVITKATVTLHIF